MILPWLLYAGILSSLFAVAAWSLEVAVRNRGLAIRWVWTASLLAAIAWPAATALRAGRGPAPPVYTFVPAAAERLPSHSAVTNAAAPPRQAPRAATSHLPSSELDVDGLILMGWAGISAILAASLLVGWTSLRYRRAGWEKRSLDGRHVWISPDIGPAVVGAFPGAIVVPAWLLGADRHEREMVLRHEEEHLRAGDSPLLLSALLCCVALPWNPGVWWIWRSLRRAVEMDCDRRVLSGGADPRAYARVLLDISERGTGHRLAVAALSESPSFLERRIRLMITQPNPLGARRVAATAALAMAALVTACQMDRPEIQPIAATGFSMAPTEVVPPRDSTMGGEASASLDPGPKLPTGGMTALSDDSLHRVWTWTFLTILQSRHPEVVSGEIAGERVNLYVALDGNGEVLASAVDLGRRSGSCMRILADGLGTELDREAFGGGGCGPLEAGVAGPSPVSVFWRAARPATEQERLAPTGPYQLARLQMARRPSRDRITSAVREHFPSVYETGLRQGESLWFVADNRHHVVHSGRGWQYATSRAAQEAIQRELPSTPIEGVMMTAAQSRDGKPIDVYWARAANSPAPVQEARPNPYPDARVYAVTTTEPGREVMIGLDGPGAEDPRAFRISGKASNEGGMLTAVTPFSLVVLTSEPYEAVLSLDGDGTMIVESDRDGRRSTREGAKVTIRRARTGEEPLLVPAGSLR